MTVNSNALISFRTKNARSYRDEAVLTFDALRIGNPNVVHEFSTAASKPLRILPVAGIYGANASGKTAILRAIADMRETVLGSLSSAQTEFPLRHPFLLSTRDEETDSAPTEYTIEVLIDGVRWHYGFSATDNRILTEFAFNYPHGRPKLVFDRNGDAVQIGRQFTSVYKGIAALILPQSLILSLIGVISRSESLRLSDETGIRGLFNWFTSNFELLTASNRVRRLDLTAKLARDGSIRERVLQFLRAADLGITDLVAEKADDEFRLRLKDAVSTNSSNDLVDEYPTTEVVKLEHQGADRNVFFEPMDESTGTQVWVGLVGPALHALDGGFVLLVDELDTSLHPHLVKLFVELFQNPELNPRCAQMIFNAHDTELINDHERFGLGRDQVWFTEKSKSGETIIFPLSDFKGRREDLVGKRYLNGRYGALPFLSHSPLVDSKELISS